MKTISKLVPLLMLVISACVPPVVYTPGTNAGFPSKPSHLVQYQDSGPVPPNAIRIGTLKVDVSIDWRFALMQAAGEQGCDLVNLEQTVPGLYYVAGCYTYSPLPPGTVVFPDNVAPPPPPPPSPASQMTVPTAAAYGQPWVCEAGNAEGGCYRGQAVCEAQQQGKPAATRPTCMPAQEVFCRPVGGESACYVTLAACTRGNGDPNKYPAATCISTK